MRLASSVLLVLFLLLAPARAEEPKTTPAEATRTELGQLAPDFRLETLDGTIFGLREQRGKVVLVNFFATWCPPCVAEMPHLQKEVYERFAGPSFAMIGVGREHENKELPGFRKQHGIGFTLAGDPKREAFALYAEHTIPRNVVIGPDGRILFQSHGFERPDFDRMIEAIQAALSPQAGR